MLLMLCFHYKYIKDLLQTQLQSFKLKYTALWFLLYLNYFDIFARVFLILMSFEQHFHIQRSSAMEMNYHLVVGGSTKIMNRLVAGIREWIHWTVWKLNSFLTSRLGWSIHYDLAMVNRNWKLPVVQNTATLEAGGVLYVDYSKAGFCIMVQVLCKSCNQYNQEKL